MMILSEVMWSRACSEAARMAVAFLLSLAIFWRISRTACSLISTRVVLSPPIVSPMVPTPE